MEEDFLNVHEILAESGDEPEDEPAMITGTYKVPEKTKALASQICKQNGSDLSKFIRRCCKRLVADYFPAPIDGTQEAN